MEEEVDELHRLTKQKRKLIARNNLQELSKVCNQLGEILAKLGRYEEALAEHQAEEAASVSVKDTVGIAVANRKIGECYAELGCYDEAIKHQNKHLELAQEANNEVEEQRALATIGRTHLCRSEAMKIQIRGKTNQDPGVIEALNQAEDAFYRSLDVCERLPKSEVGSSGLIQMKGRLYLNLGLVMDQRSNLQGCVTFIQKAIDLHRDNGQWEDLERSHHSLALTYQKYEDFENSLQQADSALEAAIRLNDEKLQCEDLLLIGQICMQRNNFSDAKKALRKAKKLVTPSNAGGKDVLKMLKCAAKLQQLKDSICMMESDDLESKLKAYEKMGDLCSQAIVYKSAVEFYGLALHYAKKMNKPKSDLAPLYVSLAETYKDRGQYENAARYYHSEMKCWEENPEEKCRTLLNLADCQEHMGHSYPELEITYARALSNAKKANNRKLEKRCLESLAVVQGVFDEVEKKRQTMEELSALQSSNEEISSDEEEENGDINSSQQSGNSSVLLSDSSEESDTEVDKAIHPVKCPNKKKTFRLRKNEKGETPLHRACITGDLKQVKRLIAEDHPVNIRDYSGWLPLHEAANNDFPEIVQVLLENGAWVNDRGGTHCDGITPLHDAASCGNFEVVRVLLKHGASVLAKTDKNDNVLDCLVAWRKRVGNDIDPELLNEYTALEEDLRNRLGQNWPHEKMTNTNPEGRETGKAVLRERKDNARNVSSFAAECRPRVQTIFPRKDSLEDPGPALVEENEILPDCDDWLIDDMGDVGRRDNKRRRCDILSWVEGAHAATRSLATGHSNLREGQGEKERKRKRTKSSSTISSNCEEDAQLLPRSEEIVDRQGQTEMDSSVYTSVPSLVSRLKVKVKIMDKLFLIVVPQWETISWLAKEAAQRYFNETGLRPNLALSTSEGALFSPDDTVDVVLCPNEEVLGMLQSWDLTSLTQRYVDSCKTLKTEVQSNVEKILLSAETSMIASLSNLNLNTSSFSPVVRALQCQFNLRELNLSGNEFGKQGLKALALALQKLPGLRSLDLSTNDIIDSELGEFVEPLANHKEALRLESLNLGFNPLLEEGCSNLTALLRCLPNLTALSLSSISNGLSANYPIPHLPEALKATMRMERLDLSFTSLPFVQLDQLLATLPTKLLLHLNMAGTIVHRTDAQLFCQKLSKLLSGQLCALQELRLSLCSLTDAGIAALLPGLADRRNLMLLDISGNPELTEESFTTVSNLIPVSRLNFSSCPKISRNGGSATAGDESQQNSTGSLANFDVSRTESRNLGILETESTVFDFGDEDYFESLVL